MAEAQVDSGLSDKQKCQPCFRKDIQSLADIYCSTCNEYQCHQCSTIHENYAFMNDHTIVSVAEGQHYVSSCDGDDVEETRYICAKHKKPFEFYCQQDDAFLCSKCAIISHKKCESIVDIECKDGHGGCEKLKNELVAAIDTTNQVTELLDETYARLSDDIQTLPNKLKDMKTRLIQIFDDFSKAVLINATAYSNTTKTDLAKKKAKCEEQIKSLKIHIRTIDSIMNTRTPAEKFITVRTMSNEVQQAVKYSTSLENEIVCIKIDCSFEKQLHDLKSRLLSFQESETLDISYQLPHSSTLKLISSIKLQQSGDDVKEPLYSGLDIMPDGRVVTVDNNNSKCLIYDENLNMKNSYKFPYHPQCVTVLSNDVVTVTSCGNYRLDFLNVSKTNDITLNRTCKMNASYHSISMMNDENFLVGTTDYNKPFRIVSMSGDESDVSINLPDKKYPFGTSYCTYIRGREKVVHCDRYDNTIFIYDIRSGKRVGIKHDLIQAPCGVAVGPYDHIFVGSSRTKCLVEITPCGRVLSSHQVDMFNPRQVAISKDRKHLVVSNSCSGNLKLSLYKFHDFEFIRFSKAEILPCFINVLRLK